MTDQRPRMVHQRIRAPQANGNVLVEPPLSSLPEVVRKNRQQLSSQLGDFLFGKSLDELRQQAKAELICLARKYTRRYQPNVVNDSGSEPDLPLIVSGHQPELFHPGVWFKNFLVHHLAEKIRGVGVHFLVDNDLCRQRSVRVPQEQPSAHFASVPFDRFGQAVPYEEATIQDRRVFDQFGANVADAVQPIARNPLVRTQAKLLNHASDGSENIGQIFSQFRHAIEGTFGLSNLEVPLSHIADSDPFRMFLWHLLQQAATFRDHFNGSLAEYRRVNRIRNAAQPIPDLAVNGDWIETPFWIWRSDEPVRRPLFVRLQGTDTQLGTDGTIWGTISFGSIDAVVDQFRQLRNQGIKIRTRAITTTLFARLFLADIFVHGIGGAKYDQITNCLMESFFRISPPAFVTATATLRLTPGDPADWDQQIRSGRQRLRQAQYQPETLLPPDVLRQDQVSSACASKREWIDHNLLSPQQTSGLPQSRKAGHDAIVQVNRFLSGFLDAFIRDEQEALETAILAKKRWAVLGSREFSFILFSEKAIRGTMFDALRRG
ncbi:MAG: hypothetical protein KDA87_07255 [Planctomycetales bacterium]|nr:hypothetical protein [Planctomycetales bacterium]